MKSLTEIFYHRSDEIPRLYFQMRQVIIKVETRRDFMKVQIYGKNITVTPAIAEKIEKKLNMLNKYFIIEEDVTANVVVRVYRTKQ